MCQTLDQSTVAILCIYSDPKLRQQWLVELSTAGIQTALIDSADSSTLWIATDNDTLLTANIPLQDVCYYLSSQVLCDSRVNERKNQQFEI